jgi:transcriptional regulator with XRE-family HTH domain
MRIAAGISQTEIAARLNVKQNTVSNWETGRRNPSPKQLKAMAAAYNCTVDDLLKDEE